MIEIIILLSVLSHSPSLSNALPLSLPLSVSLTLISLLVYFPLALHDLRLFPCFFHPQLKQQRQTGRKRTTNIDPKQLSRQELLLLLWAAAAPAPASESDINSTTAAGQQKDQRRT